MKIAALHELFLESSGVCTDTRKIQNNQLFFALKGDNFNGNKYAQQALASGASYAIIDEKEYAINDRYILVEEVLKTLQDLAGFHRDYLKTPIIAITGSNGKTTTKELLHVVLKQKYHCYATKGNLNNHIGVPLSLLEISEAHDLAIIEMGANHQGEIASYCTYAKPNYGLITNIGKAHLEGFGGVAGIIKGKTELYHAVEANEGLVFYNMDDAILSEQSLIVSKRFSYGQQTQADLSYSMNLENAFVRIHLNEVQIQSQMLGMYNGYNLAAAMAVGTYFKVSVAAMKHALEAYQADNNRSQIITYKSNQVILDAYNANPTSMLAALQNFACITAKKKAVFLGDMFEVGATSSEEHKAIVAFLKSQHFDLCVLVGEAFYEHKNDQFKFFRQTEEAKDWLQQQELEDYHFLIKGSRGMKMEQLIQA